MSAITSRSCRDPTLLTKHTPGSFASTAVMSTTKITLLSLPNEVLITIADDVDPLDIFNYALCCKSTYATAGTALELHHTRRATYNTIALGSFEQSGCEAHPMHFLKEISQDWRIAAYPTCVSMLAQVPRWLISHPDFVPKGRCQHNWAGTTNIIRCIETLPSATVTNLANQLDLWQCYGAAFAIAICVLPNLKQLDINIPKQIHGTFFSTIKRILRGSKAPRQGHCGFQMSPFSRLERLIVKHTPPIDDQKRLTLATVERFATLPLIYEIDVDLIVTGHINRRINMAKISLWNVKVLALRECRLSEDEVIVMLQRTKSLSSSIYNNDYGTPSPAGYINNLVKALQCTSGTTLEKLEITGNPESWDRVAAYGISRNQKAKELSFHCFLRLKRLFLSMSMVMLRDSADNERHARTLSRVFPKSLVHLGLQGCTSAGLLYMMLSGFVNEGGDLLLSTVSLLDLDYEDVPLIGQLSKPLEKKGVTILVGEPGESV